MESTIVSRISKDLKRLRFFSCIQLKPVGIYALFNFEGEHFMAYAVIKTGGKQYRVQEGDTLDVELLDAEPGAQTEFQEVLMHSDGQELTVGDPFLKGAVVTADVIERIKGPKLIAFKYRRRKGYHRTVGHRQKYCRVKISGIKI